MDEDRNKEPRERLRNILADNDDEELSPQAEPKPELQPQLNEQPKTPDESPIAKLPRLKSTEQTPPATPQPAPTQAVTPTPKATPPPAATNKLPKSKPPAEKAVAPATQEMSRREKLLRALWTITSVISMAVNVVVIIVLVVAFWAYRSIKLPDSIDPTIANKLLGGLYSNFEKMDRATIRTVIPVDAQIPLDITVPVQTTTQITLADTVEIPNAQVVINTGGLNINSTARVTLPAGTPLNVNLNFDLPVQNTIPIHLDVPVNIPMSATELHEPFVGLQDVVRPLYCLVDPKATNLDAQLICQ